MSSEHLLSETLGALIAGEDLSARRMEALMRVIMAGEASPARLGAILAALAAKGETATEIAAAAKVMRELMTPVAAPREHLIDTCGTGGDGARLFNVSTGAAFVAAAGGAVVAKHGNRAASGASGSADALEVLGLPLDLNPDQIARCLREVSIAFLFAPAHHLAMKHAAPTRKELGVRTIFNVLGPLCNPAGVRRQVLGVAEPKRMRQMAEALEVLDAEVALVMRSEDGLDEISLAAPTEIIELKDGELREYKISPEDFGIARASLDSLVVDSPQSSVAILEEALAGRHAAGAAMLALNGGAALYVAGLARNLDDAVKMAGDLLDSGQAREKMRQLIDVTRMMKDVG